ncbi:unnamed protein product, partial [Brenthis ino]
MAQSSQGGSHRRSRDHEASSMRYTNTDWEAKEALYQRELDEARARATQMEKTMRWWSDCTANWREKWSKVRNERNKAREEAKQFKNKVDVLSKELATLRTEKCDLEQQIMELKKDNEKLLSIGESRIVSGNITAEDGVELRRKNIGYNASNEPSIRQRASLDSHKLSNVDNARANEITELRLQLDESCKIVQREKDREAFLLSQIESLKTYIHNTKLDTHNDRTLGSDSSHSEVERLQNELQDEIAAKQVLEEKIAENKMEIERLKSENNIQWSKRELLETENIAILRENKKLYGQVCELREQIHKLNRISDGSAYGVSFNDHNNRLESNVLYVRKTSVSPRSHESSNGSSEANLAHCDVKTNTSGEDDELAIVERNENS